MVRDFRTCTAATRKVEYFLLKHELLCFRSDQVKFSSGMKCPDLYPSGFT